MRRLLFALALVCAGSSAALAQYVSTNGFFEVDQISGCAPLTVNVTAPLCTFGSPCEMDYEGNLSFQNLVFTYTYTQPGTYNLRILFQTLGFDNITINVVPNTMPEVQAFKCSGNGVQFSIPDAMYDEYLIDYESDGTTDLIVPQNTTATYNHTYATPGMKLIRVHGRNFGAADNCSPRFIPINASASLVTPAINLLQVNDASSIALSFGSVEPNVLYKLEIATNTGAFQPLRDVYNSATQTVTGLNTESNYYCFRLGVFDPCNNTTTYSNVICSADFDVTAVNNANRLAWRTSSLDVSSYSFSRNPLPSATLSATPPQLTLDDTDIVCNTEYCYQMTTLYANGSRSISLTDCAVAISTQPPTTTENISIQVTGSTTLDLLWSQDPAFTASEYSVFKAGSAYGKSAQPEFTDNAFLLNAGECYAISYVDACGNQSARSAEACHINLSAALQTDNTVALSWNTYNGWLNGVDHYIVERYSSDGNLLSAVDAGANLTYTDTEPDPDNQVIVYRIVAYAVDGGVAESISNGATIIKQPNIYHPNTFTPNADGLNDTFQVISQYTAEVEFMVFNRWGEMLFYTTDLNVAWDGTYKGNTVPEGTYVFRCFLTDMSGVKYERSGNVVLLRKR